MTVQEIVKRVSREYHLSEDELLKKSMIEFLLKRKFEIESDILDILSKNNVRQLEELEEIVKTVKEHPSWEDFITLENLYEKLNEIKDDIGYLSRAN